MKLSPSNPLLVQGFGEGNSLHCFPRFSIQPKSLSFSICEFSRQPKRFHKKCVRNCKPMRKQLIRKPSLRLARKLPSTLFHSTLLLCCCCKHENILMCLCKVISIFTNIEFRRHCSSKVLRICTFHSIAGTRLALFNLPSPDTDRGRAFANNLKCLTSD